MLELRVLNGLHRGAALPVMEGRTSIGAGDDCDVLLLDVGIAARECVLLRHGDLIWLHPLGDGCRSARGDVIRESKRVRTRRAFQVGELWLMVCDESAPWPNRVPSPRYASRSASRGRVPAGGSPAAGGSSAPRKLVRPIVGAVVLLAFGVIASNVPMLFGGSAQAVVAAPAIPDRWTASAALVRTDTGPLVSVTPAPGQTELDAATHPDRAYEGRTAPRGAAGGRPAGSRDDRDRQALLEEAWASLQRLLRDAELDTRLQLSETGDAWQLRGAIDDEDRLRAGRLIARFLRQFPDAPAVTLQQVSQAELLPFKVDSVMSGPSASVTIGAGRRLYVGDEFGGWKVVAIDSAKVVFQGHRRVEIDW
jgi:type III secretion protein D